MPLCYDSIAGKRTQCWRDHSVFASNLFEAIAIRLEAIAVRLEAIPIGLLLLFA